MGIKQCQDLLAAISDLFSIKDAQSKVQACKQDKIKLIPDFQGHGTTTFRHHNNLDRENILSILCIFFGHDFKTEVADVVRKYTIYLLSELQELVKRTKQKYFEDTLTTEKENMQTKLIPVQIKQQGQFHV